MATVIDISDVKISRALAHAREAVAGYIGTRQERQKDLENMFQITDVQELEESGGFCFVFSKLNTDVQISVEVVMKETKYGWRVVDVHTEASVNGEAF